MEVYYLLLTATVRTDPPILHSGYLILHAVKAERAIAGWAFLGFEYYVVAQLAQEMVYSVAQVSRLELLLRQLIYQYLLLRIHHFGI